MQTIDIREKLAQIDAYWSPHVVAELNGQQVKLAKFKDEFVWHHHPDTDETFIVLEGALRIDVNVSGGAPPGARGAGGA